ncbi:hypothetical protein NA57DRAFT_53868 [Rhizodiscina lignyota]|uniref:Uncharacterized protein n=1 Tax=Rhizodiscina lignyota TaxID=1504668 RepID=A0A9P4IMF8_9PEZI|nr:hypothetical protein NA57DRAFT_53868 [Rhizodiscina lignyota]
MTKQARKARAIAARETRRALEAITPADCDPQLQSPLFGRLPPELRNQIFALAVSQHDDPGRSYVYYGWDRIPMPSPAPVKRVCTDLLSTCRLAYYETSSIPMRTSVIQMFFPNVQIQANCASKSDSSAAFITPLKVDKFTRKNQADLNHIHIFTPWLRQPIRYLFKLHQFVPKKITITVGWRDIRGRYWFYGFPITEIKFPVQLQELLLQIVDRRSSEEDFKADVLDKVDYWVLTRKDEKHLKLVDTSYGRFVKAAADDDTWYCGSLTWRFQESG